MIKNIIFEITVKSWKVKVGFIKKHSKVCVGKNEFRRKDSNEVGKIQGIRFEAISQIARCSFHLKDEKNDFLEVKFDT